VTVTGEADAREMAEGTVMTGAVVSAEAPPVALTSTLSTAASSPDELIFATNLTLKSRTRYDERLYDSWCHMSSSPEPPPHEYIVDHDPPLCTWTLRYSPESIERSTNLENVSVAPVRPERSRALASVSVHPVSQSSAVATLLAVVPTRVPSGL